MSRSARVTALPKLSGDAAVASLGFRFVKRGVGGLQELVDIGEAPLLIVRGEADAHGERDRGAFVLDPHAGNGNANTLSQQKRARWIDSPGDDREFLSSISAGHVLGADRTLQPFAERPQGGVSPRMAPGIVDPLEVIDVDDQQGKRGLMPQRKGELGSQARVQMTAIAQPRQRIENGRLVEPLSGLYFELVHDRHF